MLVDVAPSSPSNGNSSALFFPRGFAGVFFGDGAFGIDVMAGNPQVKILGKFSLVGSLLGRFPGWSINQTTRDPAVDYFARKLRVLSMARGISQSTPSHAAAPDELRQDF